MRCPACDHVAIPFARWAFGLDPNRGAFRCRCRHCGVALKAGPSTWLWLLGICGIIPLLLFAADRLGEGWGQPKLWRAGLAACLIMPSVLALGYTAWRTGVYSRDDPER